MLRRWLFAVLILLPCWISVTAQEHLQVVVLPFEIHAPQGGDILKGQIRTLLANQLKEEGMVVVEPPISDEPLFASNDLRLEQIRALGSGAGADFVIWGSLTQTGQHYSLDAKMVRSYGETPPEVLYVAGEGMENLLYSVRQLGQDISMRMYERDKVADVLFTGNKRIESEAIKRVIKTKKGGVYLAKYIRADVKAIYGMGYFGDVRVEADSTPEGKVVTFRVAEKETVRNIKVRGNKEFDDEKIKGLIRTRQGTVLNINRLRDSLKEIENLYKEEGYHHVKVTYVTKPVSEGRVDVDFVIEEGEKAFIKSISFEGNHTYDDDTLKDLMKTKKKGFFSWFTSSGDYDPEILEQDLSRVSAFYHNHGYVQARVGEPQLTYEGSWIHIAMKIEEGPQFTVGDVDITGDLIQPKEVLLEKVEIAKDQVYNRELIRNDMLSLRDAYSDAGYAYPDISPQVDKDFEEHKAHITYVVHKGPVVYFEKITIAGNTKTRDKVIRRELQVYEQELFSGRRLKRAARNLYRLDYFEDVKVNPTKGSADDKMILKIDVTEKPTGAFSFGGGYSSVEDVFLMGSISQRNFLGRGQTLSLRAQLGGTTNTFTFSFTEPWLFDTPLTAGIDLYNTERDWDTYDKDSIGGTVRFGYPVLDYTRASFSYNYDRGDIKNLTEDASAAIRDLEGLNVAHTVTGVLSRDSRDRIFQPTEGSDNSITVKHAGTPFGGDIGYTKYILDSGWYFPLFWDTVGLLHGRTGFIHGDSVGKVPLWERFYLGGMGSVRGYDWRDISPKDPDTGDETGGNKMLQFNVEFMFPLIKESGLQGVLFYDTGMAYDNGEKMDIGELRMSIGYGVRWYSPIGPIRLEYGHILDDKEGKRGKGGFEFTMGAAF
ncbi:MAG: outer membrane protein assembly factor BamA [Thermodesulfobacteriota bacterium]|nr:outer membrane protein assembly factor BamA [Thermodesulfobacteriota bacterium]